MMSATAVESSIACPACSCLRHRQLGIKADYALSQCARCQVIFLNAEAGKDAVAELYNHYYDRARFELPAAAAGSLGKLARSVEPFRQTNRWLDVGFGEGGLLNIAQQHGWNCYGTEISPQALDHGREQGWTVTATEDDPRFPRGGFDVVTMIEFLEHVPAPDPFLRAAAMWLRPGGLLYITTPNAQSLNRRLLGLRWSVLSPPEHLTIWTGGGMRFVLTRIGFQTRRIRTDGLNPTEIIANFRHNRESHHLVSRNDAAFALNSAFSRNSFRRALKAVINRILSVVRLGDTLKVWAVRL